MKKKGKKKKETPLKTKKRNAEELEPKGKRSKKVRTKKENEKRTKEHKTRTHLYGFIFCSFPFFFVYNK